MDNIILLFGCLLLGVLFQKVPAFPKNAHQVLNQFVIYISIPAIALYYIPKIELNASLLYPLGIAWLGFGLSFIFFYGLGKLLGWSKKLIGCLIVVGGLGNTSFVGFPVIEALYGKEGIETAIIVDQPGSFVVMSTLGIIVATSFSKETPSAKTLLTKILKFPPFLAFFLGLMLNLFKVDFPMDLQSVFQRVGATVSPVALVAVGFQLKFERRSLHWPFLGVGLLFKLIITPLFFFVLYKLVLGADGLPIDVSIIEAAMAPMITGAILASSYGLKPKLSNMMVGVGIPLSFVTLALWYFILLQF
ncbi:AEC family transporter [Flavobacterium sp. NRK F10]|uniref:AEC family transporter n=1 Tax=Flavobacterium sp. NRK F10 TaxID=2954931 RepID=UPI00209138CA|nr:AEC family transporter [Flavobacterium sp. NRK F10]MCO6175630.1 AEC family transporter [Flavobacterium sp. NRK F10]